MRLPWRQVRNIFVFSKENHIFAKIIKDVGQKIRNDCRRRNDAG